MDKLFDSAKAFSKLLAFEYEMVIARKAKAISINIIFKKENFKHLAGIQYLDDIRESRLAASKLFDDTCSGIIVENDLKRSINYDKIVERLENLKNLESYIDNNMLVFNWNRQRGEAKGSSIEADYGLSESTNQQKKAYIFLKEVKGLFSTNNVKVVEIKQEKAISFFLSYKNYTKDQALYTLLKNEKKNIKTGESIVLYDYEEEKQKKSKRHIAEKESKDQPTNKITIQSKTKLMIKEESEKVKQSTYDLSNENEETQEMEI